MANGIESPLTVRVGKFLVEQYQSTDKNGKAKGAPHARIHSGNARFALYLRSVDDVDEFEALTELDEFWDGLREWVKAPRVLSKADEAEAELKRLREELAALKASAAAGAGAAKAPTKTVTRKRRRRSSGSSEETPF